VAIDWLHLVATAVWIGGLVGLVATIPQIAYRTEVGRLLLHGVVGRFSVLALNCVAVLALTGLYSAWVHLGSLGALTTTTYGKALAIKLALVVGLVALGAFNMLWVRPRLALRAAFAGEHELAPRPPVHHFRRSVGVEMILGVAVLLVVAILTGLPPSREALTQIGTTNLTQRQHAGDLTIALTPSTLQPGTITYDVNATKGEPVSDAQRVTLRFASPELGAEETEAGTTAQGDGHYIATGAYTTLAGNWQVRVIVRRAGVDDVTASFTLPVGGMAVPSPVTDAATPRITAAVVAYGIAAVVVVLAILILAPRVTRRLIARQTQTWATGQREKAGVESSDHLGE
jgi:copper transport protein